MTSLRLMGREPLLVIPSSFGSNMSKEDFHEDDMYQGGVCMPHHMEFLFLEKMLKESPQAFLHLYNAIPALPDIRRQHVQGSLSEEFYEMLRHLMRNEDKLFMGLQED